MTLKNELKRCTTVRFRIVFTSSRISLQIRKPICSRCFQLCAKNMADTAADSKNFLSAYIQWRNNGNADGGADMGTFKNKLESLTASQFMDIWNHYDADGNGYIEEDELEQFLKEFLTSGDPNAVKNIPDNVLRDMRKAFMAEYDKNGDGKIDIKELAHLLPTEQNFLLLFRYDNMLESSVDFMRIWREFDADRSGYIDADELKNFLRQLITKKTSVDKNIDVALTDEKLDEYAQMILKLYDLNHDGKLQLSEMARLLPVKQNILTRKAGGKGGFATGSNLDEVERIFDQYDKDGNGMIDNVELDALCKDLLSAIQTDYTQKDLDLFREALMVGCDRDRDNKLSVKDLSLVLRTLSLFEESQQAL